MRAERPKETDGIAGLNVSAEGKRVTAGAVAAEKLRENLFYGGG